MTIYIYKHIYKYCTYMLFITFVFDFDSCIDLKNIDSIKTKIRIDL